MAERQDKAETETRLTETRYEPRLPDLGYYKKNMKEIIVSKGNLYQLIRVLKEDSLKNPDISVLKQLYHCDTLLRKQGLLYFCRLIEEAEIITN